jgi:4-diphosphocytidyl-2-C-methyl-D-erythritol kinase
MTTSLKAVAPAKVNLNLHVVGRREDGKHLLDMLTARVSLFDELTVTLQHASNNTDAPMVTVSVSGNSHASLAIDATETFRRALTWLSIVRKLPLEGLTWSCHLHKRIPIGGGLGGGSSDVALFMKLVCRLLGDNNIRWNDEELSSIADMIGADVPFFLTGRNGRVLGIGERIIPLKRTLPPEPFLLVNPQQHISTAEVFALRRRSQELFSKSGEQMYTNHSRQRLEWSDLLTVLNNDLESYAVTLCQLTREVLTRLKKVPQSEVMMTGSGSTLFLLPKSSVYSLDSLVEETLKTLGGVGVTIIPVRFLS